MAVVDYYLKIDGIDGESQDQKHKGEIEIQSWSWGETNSGSMTYGGGGGTGRSQPSDFHFVKKVDKASPALFLACADGEHIKKAVLSCRKAGKNQQDFLIWTFEDFLVASYQVGGSESSDVIPMDQISINFTKATQEYKEQKADGSLAGGVKKTYHWKEHHGE